jgi:hypothetical protein
MLRPNDIIIDDDTPLWPLLDPVVGDEPKGRGLIPRDPRVHPLEMFDPPTDLVLIPESEWEARIKEGEETQSFLSHFRLTGMNGQPIPSLDQGQVGYCWAHSPTHAIMLDRAKANLPYVPLSAYAIAATIKKGKDEGGWCGLSAEFTRSKGVPSQAKWPQGDRSYTKYDKPDVWEDAARHKVTEDWVDLTRAVHSQNLTFAQVMTCLLLRIPLAVDFNWWGHSVCGMDPVMVEKGSFGIRIWNSWGDKWGDKGMGVLRGTQSRPNGAVAFRATTASD